MIGHITPTVFFVNEEGATRAKNRLTSSVCVKEYCFFCISISRYFSLKRALYNTVNLQCKIFYEQT